MDGVVGILSDKGREVVVGLGSAGDIRRWMRLEQESEDRMLRDYATFCS